MTKISEFIREIDVVDPSDWKSSKQTSCKVSVVEVNGQVCFEHVINKKILEKARELHPKKYEKSSQTLIGSTYDHLLEQIYSMSQDISDTSTFADNHGERVIFIKFKGTVDPGHRHEWCGADMGTYISTNFNFFMGYRLVKEVNVWMSDKTKILKKYSAFYKESVVKGGPGSYKKGQIVPFNQTTSLSGEIDNYARIIENNYLIVEWTQEIEDFLSELERKFVKLNNDLNEYLKDLNKEKLMNLIENKGIKLLN